MLETIISGLTLGLMGSGHCVVMCGGIVSSLSLKSHVKTPEKSNVVNQIEVKTVRPNARMAPTNSNNHWPSILLYQFGRLSSYTIAGFMVGFLGNYLGTPLESKTHLPLLKFLSAFLLILMGLNIAKVSIDKLNIEKLGQFLWKQIQPLSRYFLPLNTPKKAYFLGVVWGWLPCGLVYTSLGYAMSTANSLSSSLFMLSFGIGTLPSMLTVSGASVKVKKLLNNHLLQKLMGLLFIFSGFFLIWQIFQSFGGHMHH